MAAVMASNIKGFDGVFYLFGIMLFFVVTGWMVRKK